MLGIDAQWCKTGAISDMRFQKGLDSEKIMMRRSWHDQGQRFMHFDDVDTIKDKVLCFLMMKKIETKRN